LLLKARQFIIERGGHVVAPCPHSKACPLKEPSWCHFSVRLERSFLHRQAKLAHLPYEDEKYSYAILSKEPPPPASPRLLADPQLRSGHLYLSLCTPTVLQTLPLPRRHKELYKRARKSLWGHLFDTSMQ